MEKVWIIVAGVCIALVVVSFFLYNDAVVRDGNLFATCASVEIPEVSVDTVLNKENNTIEVFWSDPKTSENKSTLLPYDSTGIYEGCSDSAKRVLKHVSSINGVEQQ